MIEQSRALRFFLRIILFVKYIAYLIGVTLLVLVSGHFLIGAVKHLNSFSEEFPGSPGFEFDSPQMREFSLETERAIEVHFEPYFHWKGNPSSGNYVNVDDDGNRKTVKSPNANAAKVFCLGGSAMWGRGVPDQYTLPSILQTFLGNDYDLYNFGQMAFVTVQELNLLLEKLSFGKVPDIVIFYDGVNDGYAGVYSPAIPRDPQMVRMEHRITERQKRQGFFGLLLQGIFEKTNYRFIYDYKDADLDTWGKEVESDIEANVQKTLDAYEEFVKQAKGIADVYDFKVFFFWQPNIFSLDKRPTAYERQILETSDEILVKSQHAVYKEAKRRFANNDDVFFLGEIFADFEQPIYIDFCHVRPRGNKMIIEEMYRSIKGSI